MSKYASISATCEKDFDLAAAAIGVVENLAEAIEGFDEKQHVDAVGDLHSALLNWEELFSGLNQDESGPLIVRIAAMNEEGQEETVWILDPFVDEWDIDLRMSIFHGRIFFKPIK